MYITCIQLQIWLYMRMNISYYTCTCLSHDSVTYPVIGNPPDYYYTYNIMSTVNIIIIPSNKAIIWFTVM